VLDVCTIMVYFFNRNINEEKDIRQSLKEVYGLNDTSIFVIFCKLGLNIYKKYNYKVLTKLQRQMLINYVDRTFVLNEELRKLKKSYVKRFKDFFCWKSFRYKKHLPVNGQRTQTNARTCKKISV